jgi:LPS-assembly protein
MSAGHNSVHTDPILTAPANQFRFRGGFGDLNHRGLSAGFEAIYDYKEGALKYTTSQITYNTDCCGFSLQIHSINFGSRVETVPRFAFTIANIATPFGNLKKQDRMF